MSVASGPAPVWYQSNSIPGYYIRISWRTWYPSCWHAAACMLGKIMPEPWELGLRRSGGRGSDRLRYDTAWPQLGPHSVETGPHCSECFRPILYPTPFADISLAYVAGVCALVLLAVRRSHRPQPPPGWASPPRGRRPDISAIAMARVAARPSPMGSARYSGTSALGERICSDVPQKRAIPCLRGPADDLRPIGAASFSALGNHGRCFAFGARLERHKAWRLQDRGYGAPCICGVLDDIWPVLGHSPPSE